MKSQLAVAPKLAALEASGNEWSRMAASFESSLRELQQQVQSQQWA
jgi:hypothetical protein